MTSSPAPTPSASSTSTSASVPFATPTASRTPRYPAASRSNAATLGPRMNSPPARTWSIASRMRSSNGAYCAFTSTSGIGRTGRKSRSSPPDPEIARQKQDCCDDGVLDVVEVVVEVLVAPPGTPPDARECERPDGRADRRQHDVWPERHSEDPGRD